MTAINARPPLLALALLGALFALPACGTDAPPADCVGADCPGDADLPIGSCVNNLDCPVSERCDPVDGICVPRSSTPGACTRDEECPDDHNCQRGICFKDRPAPAGDTGPIVVPDEDAGSGADTDTDVPCQGCVVAGSGECLSGDTTTSCGAGGEECQTCQGAAVCNEGMCEAKPSCDASSCPSGCCAGDTCISSPNPAQCGVGGAECQTCPEGAACVDGECALPCGPTTCPGGCCQNGECKSGARDDACGAGGQACSTCAEGSQDCIDNKCVNASCSTSCAGCCDGSTCLSGTIDTGCGTAGAACVSCGAGRSCNAMKCSVRPGSRWELHLVSGEVPKVDANNSPWDPFGGLPDPYARVRFKNYNERSASVSGASKPIWNELLVDNVRYEDLKDGFTIQVWDSDLNADDLMGSCKLTAIEDRYFGTGRRFGVTCRASGDKVEVRTVWQIDPA